MHHHSLRRSRRIRHKRKRFSSRLLDLDFWADFLFTCTQELEDVALVGANERYTDISSYLSQKELGRRTRLGLHAVDFAAPNRRIAASLVDTLKYASAARGDYSLGLGMDFQHVLDKLAQHFDIPTVISLPQSDTILYNLAEILKRQETMLYYLSQAPKVYFRILLFSLLLLVKNLEALWGGHQRLAPVVAEFSLLTLEAVCLTTTMVYDLLIDEFGMCSEQIKCVGDFHTLMAEAKGLVKLQLTIKKTPKLEEFVKLLCGFCFHASRSWGYSGRFRLQALQMTSTANDRSNGYSSSLSSDSSTTRLQRQQQKQAVVQRYRRLGSGYFVKSVFASPSSAIDRLCRSRKFLNVKRSLGNALDSGQNTDIGSSGATTLFGASVSESDEHINYQQELDEDEVIGVDEEYDDGLAGGFVVEDYDDDENEVEVAVMDNDDDIDEDEEDGSDKVWLAQRRLQPRLQQPPLKISDLYVEDTPLKAMHLPRRSKTSSILSDSLSRSRRSSLPQSKTQAVAAAVASINRRSSVSSQRETLVVMPRPDSPTSSQIHVDEDVDGHYLVVGSTKVKVPKSAAATKRPTATAAAATTTSARRGDSSTIPRAPTSTPNDSPSSLSTLKKKESIDAAAETSGATSARAAKVNLGVKKTSAADSGSNKDGSDTSVISTASQTQSQPKHQTKIPVSISTSTSSTVKSQAITKRAIQPQVIKETPPPTRTMPRAAKRRSRPVRGNIYKSYSRWPLIDVKKLVDGVNSCDVGKWKAISDMCFGGEKTGMQLKDKWTNLTRYGHVEQDHGKWKLVK